MIEVGRRKRQFVESAALNNTSYTLYYNRLFNIAVSLFDWMNLPDTVDGRFLETTLLREGAAVYFNDGVIGNLALRVSMNGPFDVYGIPVKRRGYGYNGVQYQGLTNDNSVIIFNDYMHLPVDAELRYFAKRLYNLDRAIDVNCNAQKTPVLVMASENERLSLTNLYMQYDGNQQVVYTKDTFNPESIKVLKTDAPFNALQISDVKQRIWNEALTYLGVPNIAVTKKERMITDEVVRGQGGVVASKNSRLKARQDAVDKINQMFDTDIEVVFNLDGVDCDIPSGGGGV